MTKRVLFTDRDGTLIEEPEDKQVDSLGKLRFIPGAIHALYRLQHELGYELVIVTNQDGLGTNLFPEETFLPAQNLMLETFEGEGVTFADVIIDRTFLEDNAPTRKPGTALLTKYIEGDYDLGNSWVIGDRETDVELAKNLGTKSIRIASSRVDSQAIEIAAGWEHIFNAIALPERLVTVRRQTAETEIDVTLLLDGTGQAEISTGVNFFDHMLEQLAKHSGCNIFLKTQGDLEIDEHHTIEDTALALGEAFKQALGDGCGIERYGFMLPMDDCLARVAIDFSGRPWLVWVAEFKREKIGDMPTEMFRHFFKSFSDASGCNINISATGANEHHKIESIFKALARSIRAAVRRDPERLVLPSTKGVL